MGGLAKGLSASGFNHSKFVELNKHACSTLRMNFNKDLVFEGNVQDFKLNEIRNIDLVAGGPPCQPFSLGGKHKAYDDNRDMFPYAINVIEKLQPKAFIFENVKGLLRGSFSKYFEYIILRLSFPDLAKKADQTWLEHLDALKKAISCGLHYDVSYKLINSANYGIPQTRERVFIVGIRSDLNKVWTFPDETHSKELLVASQADGMYWNRHNTKADLNYMKRLRCQSEPKQQSLFSSSLKAWQTVRDAVSHLPDPLCEHDIDDHIYKGGARSYPGHTGSYHDLPAKTLKAGVHGVPGGENMVRYADGQIRYFTVHEAKLLQTFPSNFKVSGAWGEAMRQIGNAVPVDLASIIGKHLQNILCDYGIDRYRTFSDIPVSSNSLFTTAEVELDEMSSPYKSTS